MLLLKRNFYFAIKVFNVSVKEGIPVPKGEISEIGYFPGISEKDVYESSIDIIKLYKNACNPASLSLPRLTKKNLAFLLSTSFHFGPHTNIINVEDPRLKELLRYLEKFRDRNCRRNFDGISHIANLIGNQYEFPNSEGTEIWLSMVLAIKELYALSDEKLARLIKIQLDYVSEILKNS